ncbi:MAG: hypothetical protein M3O73_01200 [Actinomycetota bacterium]|nr:hypothetical protein [Actinomycetota bacterium]
MSQTHGARGELRVRDVENQQARIVRQVGVSYAELDPMARALITNLSRVRVQLRHLERYSAEHYPDGVDAEGKLPSYSAYYVALLNSERHAVRALAAHLPTAADAAQRRMREYVEALDAASEEVDDADDR